MKTEKILNSSNIEESEKFNLIQFKVNEHRIGQIWKFFEVGGFEPILIKGWVTARTYPKPHQRQFVDIDLVFKTKQFEPAKKYYDNKSFGILIDFHKEVRHLDSLSFERLFENSELAKCGGVQIRILCEEDHLRLMCVHWLNDGGEYKDKLWDIYHAVNNRKSDFDWNKCLGVVNEKRRFWIVCAIGLCQKYLDLDLAATPISDAGQNLPKWLIKTLEKEWASEIRLKPLDHYFATKKELWIQLKKRFPPNPIQATIETDGYFEKYPRFYYQTLDIIKRIKPSFTRISAKFKFKDVR